jgi:hypothetical protein
MGGANSPALRVPAVLEACVTQGGYPLASCDLTLIKQVQTCQKHRWDKQGQNRVLIQTADLTL